MRFDKKNEILCLSARELTLTAVRHLDHAEEDRSLRPLTDEIRRHLFGEKMPVTYTCSLPPIWMPESEARPQGGFSLTGYADLVTPEGITLGFCTEEPVEDPSAFVWRVARGEAFLTAYLCCVSEGRAVLQLSVVLHRPKDGKEILREETVTLPQLEKFLRHVFTALGKYAGEEMERVVVRMPTLAAAPFPFDRPRDGQRTLMRSCFAAIRSGKTLFAEAPTGTGKTVSVLYPAIRALGQDLCDKIFYLTPKNTSAQAAVDTVARFSAAGVLVRALRLTAKETLCAALFREAPEGSECCGNCRSCPFSRRAGKKMHDGARLLYANGCSCPSEEALLQMAKQLQVCPYELSLSCAELADVVIGDCNYLFDPAVALRRFFEEGEGRWVALMDEAHNLPERGREMYSMYLHRRQLEEVLSPCLADAQLKEAAERFFTVCKHAAYALVRDNLRQDSRGEQVGFGSQGPLPTALAEAGEALADALSDRVYGLREQTDASAELLRQAWRYMEKCRRVLQAYDAHYVTYALRENGEESLVLYCVDPSARIRERAARCRSAVFFSATLSPLEYYSDLLGGDRHSLTEQIPSPFDPDHLCIAIMDKINTRYTAREETRDQIVRAILETMRGRVGNYMVFFPSFHYMEQVAQRFRQVAPKIACAVQKRHMTRQEREAFLAQFREGRQGHFVGFCVLGGIYAEGIDLVGDRLIGAVVVGVGIPQLSADRELVGEYYQNKSENGKEFAYLYPGMNRVLQAAGRVIRREEDRGVLVLIDERFRDPAYRKIIPAHWRGLRYAPDTKSLGIYLRRFWAEGEQKEKRMKT